MKTITNFWRTYWYDAATELERATIAQVVRNPLLPVLYAIGGVWAVVLSWGTGGLEWELLSTLCVFVLLAVPLLLIDFKHLILPDLLIWPGVVVGLFLIPLGLDHGLWNGVMAGLLASGLFYGIRWAFWRLRRVEAMGLGDVKLMLMLGLWGGLSSLPLILVLSSLFALIAFATRLAWHGTGGQVPLPFGPFLLAGAWLSLLYHDVLWRFLISWRGAIF